jgi:hypothetical protein
MDGWLRGCSGEKYRQVMVLKQSVEDIRPDWKNKKASTRIGKMGNWAP